MLQREPQKAGTFTTFIIHVHIYAVACRLKCIGTPIFPAFLQTQTIYKMTFFSSLDNETLQGLVGAKGKQFASIVAKFSFYSRRFSILQ